MADDWKIVRDKEGCQKPGCPLATSKSYLAVLEWAPVTQKVKGVETEIMSCIRRELCDACFQDHERKCDPEKPPIFWRALRKVTTSKEPVLDLQSLRMLFDRLGNVEDERARALRYFCALLLLRKRVLKMAKPKTREQEQADLVLRDPKIKDMEPVCLIAPAINMDDLGAIKDELLAMLGDGSDEDAQDGEQGPEAVSQSGTSQSGASQSASGASPSGEGAGTSAD